MTDHTQDVREIASVPLLSALHDLAVRIPGLAGGCHCNLVAEVVLDALLPAVTPVIRQQVAGWINDDITDCVFEDLSGADAARSIAARLLDEEGT